MSWTKVDDIPPKPTNSQESTYGALVDAVLASDGEWFTEEVGPGVVRTNIYTKLRQVAGSRVLEVTIRGDRVYVRRRLLDAAIGDTDE